MSQRNVSLAVTGTDPKVTTLESLESEIDASIGQAYTDFEAGDTTLQTNIDGKAALSHVHTISDVTSLQTTLDGKAASSHVHTISDVTSLQTTLDGKASSSHAHTISDVTGLQTSLDAKADSSSLGTAATTDSSDYATAAGLVATDAGLAAEIVRATAAETANVENLSKNASALYARIGDAPHMYTASFAGGNVSARAALDDTLVTTVSNGASLRYLVGTNEVCATRQMYPVQNRVYRVTSRGGCESGNLPTGATYEVGVAWYDNTRTQLTGDSAETVYRSISDVSQTVISDFWTFGHAGNGADVEPPTSAVYAIPFLRITSSTVQGAFYMSALHVEDGLPYIDIDRLRQFAKSLDTAPTAIGLTGTEVDEAASIGTVIGSLFVTDTTPSGAPTYSLTNTAGGLFSLDIDRIIVADTLGVANKGTHVITVEAVDWLDNVLSQSLVVEVVEESFHPSDVSSVTYVLDPSDTSTLFEDTGGNVAASVNGVVGYVSSSGAGSKYFYASSNARRPSYLVDSSGLPYLYNNGNPGSESHKRLRSDTPVIGTSGSFYIGITFSAETTDRLPICSQRDWGDFSNYTAAGNFLLEANTGYLSNGTPSNFSGRGLAAIEGITDGFGALGNGETATAYHEADTPMVWEVLVQPGDRASEFRINGVVVDRFTDDNDGAVQEYMRLFHNSATVTISPSRIYGFVAIADAPSTADQASLFRWLREQGGVDLGTPYEDPGMQSLGAIAVDIGTGKVLQSKSETVARAPVSTAKMMNALVVTRNVELLDSGAGSLSSEVTIVSSDLWSGTTANLQADDVVSVIDLLNGAILPSGNDAAAALARAVGSVLLDDDGVPSYTETEARARFLDEMNVVAAELGMTAGFNSVVGGNTPILPWDVYLFFAESIEDSNILTIAGRETHDITVTGANARLITVTNSNLLVTEEGTYFTAGKPGSGTNAGYNVVSLVEPSGSTGVVLVTMKSTGSNRRSADQVAMHSKILRDWVWSNGEPIPVR